MQHRSKLVRENFGRRRYYYAARVAELLIPLQILAVRCCVSAKPKPPGEWRRGLILGSHHIGDVLWRTASLDKLQHGLPDIEWYYLTSPAVAPILENNPHLKGVLPFYQHHTNKATRQGIQEIRSMQFDVALCTNKYNYGNELCLALRCGIPNRVCYTYKGLSALVTHPVPIRQPQPFPAYVRDIVASVTCIAPDWPLTPKIYLSEEHRSECEKYLCGAGLSNGHNYAVVFNTGRTSRTVLPHSTLAAVATRLAVEKGLEIILAGAPNDISVLDNIAQKCRVSVHICAGAIGLCGLAALLERASVVLCPDAGPRHMANAVGTPVVFLRRLDRQNSIETGSYCDNETDLFEGVDAKDCEAIQARLAEDSVFRFLSRRMRSTRGLSYGVL